MGLIVDLIIVVIILLFTFIGRKRGLIKVGIKLCTFIIAIILAICLFKPVTTIIVNNTSIDENIENAITSKILPDGASENDEVSVDTNLPKMLLEQGSNTIKDVAHSFTITLMQTACFLIIFVLTKIILKFVTILADLIAKLPILKQFNELGGTIYGFLEGLFIVFIAFAVISLISPLIDSSILNSINQSTLGNWLYNNNIIIKFIM